MAISANTVWELRQAGNDSNGGGFVAGASGVDRSQSDSAHVVIDGVTITAVVHTTTTQLTLVGYTVSADDVGNLVQNVSGSATVGFYEITAVDVPNNRWTVDRSVGTAAQTVIGNMGGAVATFSKVNSNCAQGNTIYVKGSFTITTVISLITVGTVTSFIKWLGYTTTRGDNGKATVTCATNSVNLFQVNGTSGRHSFSNFTFSHTAGTRGIGFINVSGTGLESMCWFNCVFDGLSDGVQFNTYKNAAFVNCEIKNCTNMGLNMFGTGVNGNLLIDECWIHNNTSHGVQSSGDMSHVTLRRSTFANNGSDGFNSSEGNTHTGNHLLNVYECVFYNNTGDGLSAENATTRINLIVKNSVFWSNGGWGINCGITPFMAIARTNAFGDNTSGTANNFTSDNNDVSITVDPFVDAANGDFSLNTTAGGGSALKGVGSPSDIPFDI